MLERISIILYLIASVLNFINGDIILVWITVLMGIITLNLIAYCSHFRVSPQVKEIKETVYQMEADGASDEEILEFLNRDIDVDESKLIDAPLWMNILTSLGIMASFILLGIGVIRLS